ncbi:MAG: hypothetical protein OSJ38_07280 [Lachnospiraceae bacterium]|nr:hypothetical protein [Lachnospiraceae bacterium]
MSKVSRQFLIYTFIIMTICWGKSQACGNSAVFYAGQWFSCVIHQKLFQAAHGFFFAVVICFAELRG